jgi:hypothetical protein
MNFSSVKHTSDKIRLKKFASAQNMCWNEFKLKSNRTCFQKLSKLEFRAVQHKRRLREHHYTRKNHSKVGT